MLKKFLARVLIGLILPNQAWLQTVQITEIAPHSLAQQAEWFEFKATGIAREQVEQWQIGNGTNTPKRLSEFTSALQAGDDDYFYLQPSPLSLPNHGSTIQILDNESTLLTEIVYPSTKSSSTKTYEQRETWSWSEQFKQLIPQLVRAPEQNHFHHTQGQANGLLPTPPTEYTLLVNEVSPDHETVDFIELLVVDGPEDINLQYTEIKHNGTVLWRFESPFMVSPKDYLVLKVGTEDHGLVSQNPVVIHTNQKSGLSSGSGTVEVVGLSDTSLEQRLDTLCWKNETLSQTEQTRVNKFIAAQDWQGSCVDIQTLIKNESIGRNPDAQDSHSQTDFFRHFNGSVGVANQSQNKSPEAIITVQGRGKTVGPVPFFLNVSGQDSTDPDGSHDLNTYQWQLADKTISTKANPAGFYVETSGEQILHLTVTDQSGASDQTETLIVGLEPGKRSTTNGSDKAKAAVVQQQIKDSLASAESGKAEHDFFAPFLARTDWTHYLANQTPPLPYPDYTAENTIPTIPKAPLFRPDWPRRLNLPEPVRQRARKNLSVIFSWRESPWPGLAAEWTDVVAEHRKSAHFAAGYLGF